MSSIELPDDMAAALAAAAAERGITADELATEALAERFRSRPATRATPATGDALKAFIGCIDSGDPDWAHNAARRRLSFAALGSSDAGRGAAHSEELLEEGGFGIDSADQ